MGIIEIIKLDESADTIKHLSEAINQQVKVEYNGHDVPRIQIDGTCYELDGQYYYVLTDTTHMVLDADIVDAVANQIKLDNFESDVDALREIDDMQYEAYKANMLSEYCGMPCDSLGVFIDECVDLLHGTDDIIEALNLHIVKGAMQ